MSLWLAAEPLVLASKSSIRRAVLQAAGIPVQTQPADVDERGIEAASGAMGPGEAAALLAAAKAKAGAWPGRLVLGADQTLALDGRRFSKPADAGQARAQLQALSGRTHELHSAIALVHDGKVAFRHVEIARLTMRALSEPFIDRYLAAAGEAVTRSVGAYQFESLGIHLFARVEGDHFTILGLPLLPLLDFLRRGGWIAA